MKYEYWFANIKELNSKTKMQIRSQFATAEELYYIEEKKLKRMGIEEAHRRKIMEAKIDWQLESEYEKLKKKNVEFCPIMSDNYPKRLKCIPAPPYALYVKGKLPEEERLSVAIVGARECSTYGEVMTRQYTETLTEAGVQIISGMARGIDGVGQKSAVAAGGSSFAVLGCGVDVCYPREHSALYQDLQKSGGVISEQPLGTQPLAQFFPARNRIISGLADVVLVIEAKEKSGSLITADMALEQGKDVYAMPGPNNSALSKGCHNLIKQGAGILLSPKELLEELGIFYQKKLEKSADNKILLESAEILLYSGLDFHPKSVHQMINETGLTVSEVLEALMGLELKGYIREVSKNYYVKVK